MSNVLYVAPVRSVEETNALAGEQANHSHFNRVFRTPIELRREDGTLLARLVRNEIAAEEVVCAFHVFRKLGDQPTNRGMAAIGQRATLRQKADGTKSGFRAMKPATLVAMGLGAARSSIVGAMDRVMPTPFCRLTRFTRDHYDEYASTMPFVRAVNDIFKRYARDRWDAQMAMIEKTDPAWVIPDTAFTTITVNKNFPTRFHQDVGDLKEGIGVMAVLRSGAFSGGYFTLPRYGVAFDLAHGDVMIADVHEWHGNTKMRGLKYERVSCVFYYRERMASCGTPAEELERAQTMGAAAAHE